MKLTITIFLFFIAQALSAQTADTIWYDNKWKKTDEVSARHYFRLTEKISEKNYEVKDYYKTKSLQMEGFYSSLTPAVKHGKFQYWFSDGNKQMDATYENGKPTRVCQYNRKGNIIAEWERVTTYQFVNGRFTPINKVVYRIPRFAGGEDALVNYVRQQIRFPEGSNLSGKVIVEFSLDQTGKAVKPVIKQSLSPQHDQEVIRLVKNMPNWEVGKQDGKFVPIKMQLPIEF